MNLTKIEHEPKSTSAREYFQKENFQNDSHLITIGLLIHDQQLDRLTQL